MSIGARRTDSSGPGTGEEAGINSSRPLQLSKRLLALPFPFVQTNTRGDTLLLQS